MAEEQIFRQKSLDKLSSPERLDQMLRIVKPQSWLLLLALSLGASLVVVWAIIGLVPSTVTGPAVLVLPKQMIDFQSPAAGQIATIKVLPGDEVHKGDVLATLEQPILQKELEVARSRLELFTQLGSKMTEEEVLLAEEQRESIARRKELLQTRIEDEDRAAEDYKARNENLLTEQRTRWKESTVSLEGIREALEADLETVKGLVAKEYMRPYALLEPRRVLVEAEIRLANLAVEDEAMNSRQSQIQENYDLRKRLVQDLRLRLSDLELEELDIRRRLMVDEHENQRDIEEVTSQIVRLETQVTEQGQLLSEYAGTVMEITAAVGDQVAVGQALGKIGIADPDAELKAIAYFPIKEGMQIELDQDVSVSPSLFERARFGSIVGRVERVSDFPVGIDAATREIGDQERARALLGGESRVQVTILMERDQMSSTGYRWISGTGPPDAKPLKAGTTAEVRVTLEERTPITLVLPFLKSLLGQ